MRDLIRSSEGTIGKAEFIKGLWFMLGLCAGLAALYAGVIYLNLRMDWMTVAIAPIFGVILFFATSSILYFWFCLFIKRFRGLGQPVTIIYVWLLLAVLAGVFDLLKYENDTLDLATNGIFAISGILSLISTVLFLIFSLILLFIAIAGPDKNVGTASCFGDISEKKKR